MKDARKSTVLRNRAQFSLAWIVFTGTLATALALIILVPAANSLSDSIGPSVFMGFAAWFAWVVGVNSKVVVDSDEITVYNWFTRYNIPRSPGTRSAVAVTTTGSIVKMRMWPLPRLSVPLLQSCEAECATDGLRMRHLSGEVVNLRGKNVTLLRRILYVFQGEITDQNGPLELTCDDDTVLWFDAAANGEDLKVETGRWRDPFTGEQTVENREFIEASGKWTAFDVSAAPPFSGLIGQRIHDTTPIKNPEERVVGVVIRFTGAGLRVEAVADELWVDVS
ncbi:hypothetical protein [Amycolatopsis sacchari]|uniref:hypothetical protein n=1 Tax=Amycolatopsis sacchari TaxID=115433 RepID=UPI003D753B4E